MAPDPRDLAWKEHGIVVMGSFHLLCKPLRTLKLTRKSTGPVELDLWNDRDLSLLEASPALEDAKPEVKQLRPRQTLSNSASGHVGVSVEAKIAVEASFGVKFDQSSKFEVEFYSEGVLPGDLQTCISRHQRSNDWALLTKDSRGLLGVRKATCGVVTEVFYAKSIQVDASSNAAVNAATSVPATMAAGGVLPGGADNVGGGFSVDIGGSRHTAVTADGFYPIAFKFMLVSWDGTKWEFLQRPNTRPRAMAAAAVEGQPEEWPFAETPSIAKVGERDEPPPVAAVP